MLNLLRYEIFSRRNAMILWGIALAAFGSMYVLVFPAIGEQAIEALGDLEIYAALGMDIGSFAGYIASVVVQIMPIILGVYMIMAATGTLGGEEENGTLELVVAMPLPRWQIVMMKAIALMVVSFVILLIVGLGNALSLELVRQTTTTVVDVTAGQLIVALLGAWPLMVATIMMSMFFAAVLPGRMMALAVMVVIYLASYLLRSISGMVNSLEGLKNLSLFNYVDSTSAVFTDGIQASNVAVLLGIGLVFFLLTLWAFQGRNITVGQWPWRRRVTA